MLVRRRARLRKEPSQARSAFTFDAILDAAQQMVLAEGAAALQMSALTRRAGVSAGTLYQYFIDKNSILMALSDRCWNRFTESVHQMVASSRGVPLEALLERLGALVADAVASGHALTLELRRALDGVAGGEEMDLTEKTATFLAETLRDSLAVPEAHLQTLMRMMVWTSDGLVEGTLHSEASDAGEVREALLSAWRGILGIPPGASPDPLPAARPSDFVGRHVTYTNRRGAG